MADRKTASLTWDATEAFEYWLEAQAEEQRDDAERVDDKRPANVFNGPEIAARAASRVAELAHIGSDEWRTEAYEAWCTEASEWEYEHFTFELTCAIEQMGSSVLRVVGAGMGWTNAEGHTDWTVTDAKPRADIGQKFIWDVLPDTEMHIWVWLYRPDGEATYPQSGDPVARMVLEVAHHDSPTGGETYEVTAAPECAACGDILEDGAACSWCRAEDATAMLTAMAG